MTYGLLVKQSVSTADDNATHAVMAAKVDVSNADLMGVLGGEPARLLELDLGHHAGLQVGDAHDPSVLNVHLAHDQIVDGRCHLQRSRHASACQVDRCALSRTSTTQFIEHFSCSVYQFDGVKMSTPSCRSLLHLADRHATKNNASTAANCSLGNTLLPFND